MRHVIERVGNGRMCCVEGVRFELLLLIADSGYYFFNVVDIFDGSSGRWSTAVLSAARGYLAATSLPNDGLAIFAGGDGASRVLMSVIGGGGRVGGARCAAAAAADC